MAEWRTTTLGELVSSGSLSIGDGYRTKRDEHGRPGFRIIRVADINEGRIDLDSPDFVSEDFRPQVGPKLGVPGDILLTTKGTIGRVAVVPPLDEEVVYSPQVCYFRVPRNAQIERDYLRYWFGSPEFWRQASDRMNNTDMAAYINLADIRSLRLMLPPLPEQRAIAEVLGALDDKIAANARLATTADALARAEFERALSGPVRPARLGEVVTLAYGKALPATSRRIGDVAVYGSGGVVGFHDVALVREAGAVIGRKGTAGAVHWAHGPHFPIDTTFYAKPAHERFTPLFCYFVLLTAGLDELNSDSAVPGLNKDEAERTWVTVPDDAAIGEFTAQARPLFDLVAQRKRENLTLAATRDALLPALMSGRLRVRDAERLASDLA